MTVRTFLHVAALTTAFAGLASVPQAQTDSETPVVTLKSFDGFTQLRGKLVDFDGKTYRIETALGLMEIDALQVRCDGDGCPQNLLFGAKFGIHGSNTMGAS